MKKMMMMAAMAATFAAAAAGLTLRGGCLDEFRERLSRAVEEQLDGRELNLEEEAE